MYSLLFRSRWAALVWVVFMAAYAVFTTSGAGMMGFMTPAAPSAEDVKAERRQREADKFEAWVHQDTHASENREYGSGDDTTAGQDSYSGQ